MVTVKSGSKKINTNLWKNCTKRLVVVLFDSCMDIYIKIPAVSRLNLPVGIRYKKGKLIRYRSEVYVNGGHGFLM